jgi:hypothetical protein
MSKGSRQRPRQVEKEKFDSNWDAIFGKKDSERSNFLENYTTDDEVQFEIKESR